MSKIKKKQKINKQIRVYFPPHSYRLKAGPMYAIQGTPSLRFHNWISPMGGASDLKLAIPGSLPGSDGLF